MQPCSHASSGGYPNNGKDRIMRGGARAEFEPTLLDKRELDKVIEGLPFPTLAIDTAQELEFRLEATQIQVAKYRLGNGWEDPRMLMKTLGIFGSRVRTLDNLMPHKFLKGNNITRTYFASDKGHKVLDKGGLVKNHCSP